MTGPTVGQLGEKQTIELLKQYMAPVSAKVVVGPGDDCAVVARDNVLQHQVLTTDLLIEGTHFASRDLVDWEKLGRKCIAANYSDLAAMGATPESVLISLGVPGTLNVVCLEQLYRGLADQTILWGGNLVGGDIARSDLVVINVAVTGLKSPETGPCLRSGCRVGQNVYVSGALGGSRAGLDIVLKEDPPAIPLPAELILKLLDRHLLPEPQLALGQYLARMHRDVAIIDISDSLHNELGLLASASGVGMNIQLEQVPVFAGVERYCGAHNRILHDFVLFSGEEYELLFTCFAEERQLRGELADDGIQTTVTQIGKVVNGSEVVYWNADQALPGIDDKTFSHFSQEP